MARYKGTLGRPIQGISQQPYKTRLRGQCTESINMKPDVVKGLTTRAGSKFITNLPYRILDDDYIIHYKRDEIEEYFLIIPAESTRPVWGFDKKGVPVVIEAQPTGVMRDYIFKKTPEDRGLNHLTIADSTLISNAHVDVKERDDLSAGLPHLGIVYVQYANYGQNIVVKLDGVTALGEVTPSGEIHTDVYAVGTSKVASELIRHAGELGMKGQLNLKQYGNVIFISKKDGTDFELTVSDDADGGNTIGIKGHVEDVSKLTPIAPDGYVVKILPKGGAEDTAYWVKAHCKKEGDYVEWKECVAPETKYKMDETTLPCMLVRDRIGDDGKAVFKFEYPNWVERGSGNEDSNPFPQILGNKIRSMSLMQNRLVLAAGECVAMSASSDYFNFFKATTQTILDTDPYEVFADSTNIVTVRNPISFNGDLFFFAHNAQLGLQGQDIITPNEPKPLRQMSQFDVQVGSTPVAAGENIFFAFDYGRFTGIREYFTDSLTDTKRAVPITDHVNQMIEGKVRHMATSNSLNMLCVLAEDKSTLFVYDWMWQGQEKVQAAWGKWKLAGGAVINHFVFSGSYLRMIQSNGGTSKLVEFDLGLPPDNVDVVGMDYSFAMDQKVKLIAKRQPDGSWNIPRSDAITNNPRQDVVFVQGSGYEADVGTEIDAEILPDGSFRVLPTDFGTGVSDDLVVYAGVRINTLYTPSNPFVTSGDGSPTSDLDRLQVGRIYVNYDSAGVCVATVTNVTGRRRETQLYPRVIGNGLNFVGFSPLIDGTYKIPIRDKSDQYTFSLSSESTKPLQIREIEFDCNIHVRGGEI